MVSNELQKGKEVLYAEGNKVLMLDWEAVWTIFKKASISTSTPTPLFHFMYPRTEKKDKYNCLKVNV